ncbi:hypothetical protein JCM6882_007083 [Rhodosporidiobolus microsporus]
MDDELDPAFLDLDLPSHGSGLGDSLGAGFGNQLDEFDDNDDRSPQLELGSGFGNALGAELDGLDGDDDLPHSRSRHSSGGSAATAHGASGGGGGGAGDEFATPRRRNGSGSGSGASAARMSLAFELASASGPPGGRTRDLMRELGIEEDEGEEEEVLSEEEERDEQLERRLFHGERGDEAQDDPFGGASSPARRPASRLRAKPSTASFASMAAHDQTEAAEEDEDALGISQEETDAAFQEAAEALESSIATTGTFLSHLRQHTTTEIDLSSATAAPAPPIAPSLRHSSSSATLLTGSLQRSTSTPSPSSEAPAPPPPTTDYTDRQPVVEALASSVLKRLYDVASQREAQLRELTEMERVFARNEVGWQAVLAGLEPLPAEEEEEEEREGDEHPAEPNVVLPPDAAYPSSPTFSPTSPSQPSFAHLSSSHPSRTTTLSAASPALPHLHDLRTLTTSLLSALSSITDLTQVQSALSSDAGRKLRALKAQVGTVKDELGAVERSEAFVREYEAREGEREKEREGRRRESCAEQARREVEAAREALEEGWRKAQSVFRPVVVPVAAAEVGVAV